MHPPDSAFESHHGGGVSRAVAAHIKVPTALELAFGGELAVEQRIQFLPGWTIGHESVAAVFLPCRRVSRSESSHEIFAVRSTLGAT